jgi:glycolate oxidase iron-sulfur subunit
VLRALVSLVGFAQRLGLDRAVAALLPRSLRGAQSLLPVVPARAERAPLPAFTTARGERRGRVALFTGCIMSEVFAPVHRATLRVLAANGFDVVVPESQGCCGALSAHAGDLDFARGLMRTNVAAFGDLEIDALILNSAGCGAALRDARHWIGEAAAPLSDRVRDVCEFLDEVGWRAPLAPVSLRVCYDDPCHLVHGQRVQAAPRRLLERVPGLEIVPHADAAACCGAAGTYNVTQPEMSQQVLARKMDSLAAADPDVIATGNPGCLMQLRAGVSARGLAARVLHPIELLADSLA